MSGDNEALKVVNNKLSTNEHTMWYEETSAADTVLWTDACLIPYTPPQLNNGESYNVQIGYELTPIVTYHANVELMADAAWRVFTSPLLRNVILRDNYYVDLHDAEGRPIPFGLNKMSVQRDAIVFQERFPAGYTLPLFASFYTYTGHTESAYLRRDGSTPMAENYVPTDDMDIVTKKFLFEKYGPAIQLEPRKPDALDKATLYVEDNLKAATSVLTNQLCSFLFDNETVHFKCTPFYNPGVGNVYLTCNDIDIESFSLQDLPQFLRKGILNISQIDPYEKTLLSHDYYKSIVLDFAIDVQSIMMYVDSVNSYATFRLEYRYNAERLVTNEVTFGIAPKKRDMAITDLKITNIDDVVQEYISGIPTVKENSVFVVGGKISGVRKFKNPLLGKYDCTFYDEKIINNDITYPTNYPVYEFSAVCTVPKDYVGNFHFGARAFDILREQQDVRAFWYHCAIDTLSVEDRVTSGDGLYPRQFGQDYPHEQSLTENKELMLRNGVYRFPSGDYRNVYPDLGLERKLDNGPNYDGIGPDEIRWATFKFDREEYCSGVYVNIEDFQANYDADNILDGIYIFVKTPVTGWLDANKAYNGVTDPKNDGDAAFVVANSTFCQRYVTFGKRMINGPFYVRIGFANNGASFKKIDLLTNH